jgi:AbrB family looped-hinge helix DNA binding protein
MPITLKRKVKEIGGSLATTIPKEIGELLGLQPGDFVEFLLDDHNVILRKAKK